MEKTLPVVTLIEETDDDGDYEYGDCLLNMGNSCAFTCIYQL